METKTFTLGENDATRVADCISIAISLNRQAELLTSSYDAKGQIQDEIEYLVGLLGEVTKAETITLNEYQISRVADCILATISQNTKAKELTTNIHIKYEIQNEIHLLNDALKIFTQQ